MAVVTLYMSDRDSNKTFSDKKAADNYDKLLELAENVSVWMEQSIDGLSEKQCENIGMLIAENRDLLAKAIKNKPEALLETHEKSVELVSDNKTIKNEKVTKLSA
ncbi:MAG: YebG family protein [Kangiellaceae bacterium]|nr:YebG family protein [Kangiellaceae bacterium]